MTKNSDRFGELNLKGSLSILNKSQKKKYYFVSLFNLITTIFEILGLAAVYPIVSIILDYQKIEKLKKLASNYEILHFLNDYTQKDLVFLSLVSLVLFFLFKNVVIIIINYFKNKIFFSLIASISSKMFDGYVQQDISFSMKSNSAFITRNIIDQPSLYVHHVLQGIYNVIFETLFIILTLIIFVTANKTIGLSIICGALIFFLIFFYSNKYKIRGYGSSLNDRVGERLKVTREAIEGIKDITLYNKKNYFKKIFSEHTYRIVGLQSMLSIREQLPRNILEFFAVLCITVIIIFFLQTGTSGHEIIPLISLIAIGLLRIIPSLTRILSSLQRMRSSSAILNNLKLEITKFNKIKENKNIKFEYNNKIAIKDIKFYYEDKLILDNISFNFDTNTIFGIKGVSGSGKTTLLNLIIGFLNPFSGSILANSKNIHENVKIWQDYISYVPQKIFLSDDSLKNNITFQSNEDLIDHQKLDKVIEISQLNELKNEDYNSNKKIGESGKRISAGQAQRIGIARALYKNPKILILDEATSALDKETEKKIFKDLVKLKEKGMTIIIISHDPNLFKYCNSYYDLDKKQTIWVK